MTVNNYEDRDNDDYEDDNDDDCENGDNDDYDAVEDEDYEDGNDDDYHHMDEGWMDISEAWVRWSQYGEGGDGHPQWKAHLRLCSFLNHCLFFKKLTLGSWILPSKYPPFVLPDSLGSHSLG